MSNKILVTICHSKADEMWAVDALKHRGNHTGETYQLGDVGHLCHVVQCVLSGFIQHDKAGSHDGQVPQRLHVAVDASVAVCHFRASSRNYRLNGATTGHEANVQLTWKILSRQAAVGLAQLVKGLLLSERVVPKGLLTQGLDLGRTPLTAPVKQNHRRTVSSGLRFSFEETPDGFLNELVDKQRWGVSVWLACESQRSAVFIHHVTTPAHCKPEIIPLSAGFNKEHNRKHNVITD